MERELFLKEEHTKGDWHVFHNLVTLYLLSTSETNTYSTRWIKIV